jgi:hypothetical protein
VAVGLEQETDCVGAPLFLIQSFAAREVAEGFIVRAEMAMNLALRSPQTPS